MKRLFLFIFLIFAARLAIASCEFTKEDGLDVINIGGGKVYTMFDGHPTSAKTANPLLEESFFDGVMNALSLGTTSARKKALLALSAKDDYKILLDSQKKEYESIEKLLAEKKVTWLGLEYSPEQIREMPTSKEFYLQLKAGLMDPEKGGGLTEAQAEDILLQYFGAGKIIQFKRQGLESMIVPLDDEGLKKRGIAVQEKLIPCLEQLEATEQSETVRSILEATDRARKVGEMIPRAELNAMARNIEPHYAKAARCVLEENNNFIDINNQRNQKALEKIMRQNGPGFIAYGTLLEIPMKESLTQSCLNQGAAGGSKDRRPAPRPAADKRH